MDFERRLERAIVRGRQSRDLETRQAEEEAMSVEELRNRHSEARLELSEHIESCLKQIADHFPGFQYETVVRDDGWGSRITRDDIRMQGGQSQKLYSRLEMLVSPFSDVHIVALNIKGTIQNKEAMSRSHFQRLNQLDLDSFSELIDLWALEFAEKYAKGV